MSDNDLREWLEAVEQHGELQHVQRANWDLEMSSIAELVYREGRDPKPALLFDEIPGACQFELIPFCGHFWQEEKPEEFTFIIRGFLADNCKQ